MNFDILTFYITYKKVLKEIETEGYVTEEDVDKLLNEFSDNLELLDKEDVTDIVLELLRDVEGITSEEVELIVKETLKEVGVTKEEFASFKKENEAWKSNTVIELEGVLSNYYTSAEVDELIGEIQAGDIDLEMVEKLIEKMVNEEVNTINSAIAAVNDNINEHKNNTDNPHNVTKEQIGLGKVDNVKQATKKEHEAHVGKVATKTESGHVIIGDGIDVTSDGTISVKETDISHIEEHLNATDNPHKVTKEQVGLGNVRNVKQVTEKEVEDISISIISEAFSTLNKNSVGLGNVDNVKQASKVELDEHKRVVGSFDTPGHVQLSSHTTSTNSVSDGVAATPLAVKTVNDKVDEVKEIAEKAFQSGDNAKKEVTAALKEKGVNSSTEDSWSDIAGQIKGIEAGGKIVEETLTLTYNDLLDSKRAFVDGRVVGLVAVDSQMSFAFGNFLTYSVFKVFEQDGKWNEYKLLSQNGEIYYDKAKNTSRISITYGNGEPSRYHGGIKVIVVK